MAFSLKPNRESPSLGEIATDTEGSYLEDIILEPVRRSLVGMADSGMTKVYTTEDTAFKVGDIVIFQDLHHNIEAHRVAGHGSLILDGPLRGSYPPGSDVRTMMGTERVYSNGTHYWIGNAGGLEYVAPLYESSEVPRTPETGSSPQQGSTSPTVPKFGASQQDSGASGNAETPSPGRGTPSTGSPGTFGTPGTQGGTPQTEPRSSSAGRQEAQGTSGLRAGVPPTSPRTSQNRDVSPVNVDDERLLGQYFTRGAQGRGEDNRAVILRRLEENSLTEHYPIDKEKWQSLDASMPKLPQLSTDPLVQVHLRTAFERWESELISFYGTVSQKAGLYMKAVIAGVHKMIGPYRKDLRFLETQNLDFPEAIFHPNAEAHTHRYLKVMLLPQQSFDRANMVRMEPPVRLQLLMHYIRVLPADPIEQDLVQKAFLNPPGECQTTTGVLDELVRYGRA
eukprot:3176007-Amphidinium_carterae.1